MSILDLDGWRGRFRGTYRDLRLRWDLAKAKRRGPPDTIWQAPLIFIHIPKSAGSSILSLGVARTRGHQTYAFYEKWAQGREIPPTFAVTRDPYARYLSAYRYLRNGGGNGVDRAWANRNLHGDHNTFATEHLHRPEVQNWMHFRPQTEFLNGVHGAVTHILRLEALKDEWEPFARQYGLPETLPRKNTTSGREELSPAARRAVRRIYADDFDQIGY